MLPFKKILFPVDFSDQCKGAARYVAAFTGRFDASLILLNASDPKYNDPLPPQTAQRQHRLEAFSADEFEYLHVNRVLANGDAASNIISLAVTEDFDLIMMPTHGLGGFRRFLIGSVTAKVLHDADCPVWTGVHLEHTPPLEQIEFRKFLCAVDLTSSTEKVIQSAVELADEYRAKLSVIHLQPTMAGADEAKQKIESWLGPGVRSASIRVETGEVAPSIAVIAAQEMSDLLVIGRNPASGMVGRLRSHGYSIIRQSPCPVISI